MASLLLVLLPLVCTSAEHAATRRYGEIIVQYRARQVPTAWVSQATPLSDADLALIHFDEDHTEYAKVAQTLAADPAVMRVEPNVLLWTARADPSPDWAHRDLSAAQAPQRSLWTFPKPWHQPWRRLRVGVLDTGIDAHHPDLEGVVTAGVNLLDPTALHGVEAGDASAMDYNGHGTQVAGIIGARHNGFGIDGINDQVEVIPIKVFDADGTGSLADVLRGITWARHHGVALLNMSFGTYEDSVLLREAVAAAAREGMLLVAAAGNDGAGTVTYPAAYPNVLAIGSHDDAGISRFSNFGPQVDYYAPGTEVLSTTTRRRSPNPYAPLHGTSAAAAHVTGVLTWVLQAGHTGARALPFMAERSPWRLADRRLGEPRYRPLGTERILSDVQEQPLRALTVLHWDLSSHSADGRLQVEVTVQNTGNRPLPGGSLGLQVRGEGRSVDLQLGTLPALQAGAEWSHCLAAQLPAAWLTRLPTAVGARLVTDVAPLSGGGPRDVLLTSEQAPQLSVQALWLTPFNRVATNSPTVHARLTNPGNASSPPARVRVFGIAAVHEGIWSVPAQPITATHAVPALPPGGWTELQVPSTAALPPSDEITLLVELEDASGASMQRAIQSFAFAPGGQVRLLYNQMAHMGSVQAAVELLRLQNRIIPDIHLDDAPFLGTPETARDFGSAVRVGVSNWRWNWQKDWPEYPWSSKTLIDGASAADGIDVAFNDSGISTWDTHYWVVDEHDSAGLGTHSAFDKIMALMLGGRGSTIEDGAIAAYKAGEQARAWWLVGHAAHLLGDLSTGAHTINRNWHGVVGDPYHDWMGQDGHYRAWPASVALNASTSLNLYRGDLQSVAERLRFLTYSTAQIGSSFPWHRTRGWVPSRGAVTGPGNRTLGGDFPHYDHAMQDLFARFAPHPMTLRDLNADEVLTSRQRCEAVWRARSDDTLADCWDGGDGHIDRNNIDMLDEDGDLSRIADATYVHALHAMAELIYLFAHETGQVP